MRLEELREYYGTWSNMTRELGLGITTYQNWLKKGYIPYPSQLVIEKKTKKKFKAAESEGMPKKQTHEQCAQNTSE